jgi:hypothetical protein
METSLGNECGRSVEDRRNTKTMAASATSHAIPEPAPQSEPANDAGQDNQLPRWNELELLLIQFARHERPSPESRLRLLKLRAR